MKFLLINPASKEKFIKEGRCQHKAGIFATVYPPLSLVMIGTILKQHHEVSIIDGEVDDRNAKSIMKEIILQGYDTIIVNVSTPTVSKDISFILELRKKGFSGSIGVMGIHATFFAKEFLTKAPVDFVILGEPETFAFSAAGIAKSPKSHINRTNSLQPSLSDIKGIAYKKGSKIVFNENPKPDMDKLPIPDWKLVEYKKYIVPISRKPYLIVQTGRGCPYNCTFCNAPYQYGRKLRLKKIGKVIGELKSDIKLGVEDFFFFQETFNLNNSYVKELCKAIIKENLKIRWFANSRVDLVEKETLGLMKKAGCWMISLGVESLDNTILKNSKKNIDQKRNLDQKGLAEKIHLVKDSGIISMGHFILGLPGENNNSCKTTIKLSGKLGLDFAVFYIATPFPGSELFSAKEYRRISWNESADYSKNMLTGNSNIKNINIKRFVRKAYIRFYIRPTAWFNAVRTFGFKALVRTAFLLLKYR